jgi:MOSC domain-containing protein YiiM
VGIPEVLGGLAYSGGIYARVLSDGIISVDDVVVSSLASADDSNVA